MSLSLWNTWYFVWQLIDLFGIYIVLCLAIDAFTISGKLVCIAPYLKFLNLIVIRNQPAWFNVTHNYMHENEHYNNVSGRIIQRDELCNTCDVTRHDLLLLYALIIPSIYI